MALLLWFDILLHITEEHGDASVQYMSGYFQKSMTEINEDIISVTYTRLFKSMFVTL